MLHDSSYQQENLRGVTHAYISTLNECYTSGQKANNEFLYIYYAGMQTKTMKYCQYINIVNI